MGAKESKQSCISYEDAVKRVTDTELRRLKDAFKKSAGVGRLYLSRNAFQQDVLCEGVPANVTELLYSACGGTNRGISFKDLLCGLVLITRGTEDEKTRFLWNLYCNDAGTYINKSDYVRTINLHPFESVSLFAHGERVNFEQFQDWILRNRNTTVLSRWLLSDNCVSLTSELETPTFYQSLAGVTHLEEKDIGDLEKEFWRLKNSSQNGQIDLQFLGPQISPPIPKNALTGLFNAFDENRDGHIDFKELCCGVSAACRGPGVERTRFCFKIFDVDRDGMLSHDETMQMINVLLFVAKENRNAQFYKDLSKQDVITDLLEFAKRKCSSTTAHLVDDATRTRHESLTRDNVALTAEDFMMWNVECNLKLMQPFLDLIFELCHIVFGLWPQCRHMEYDVVRGWLKREEKRQYRVGQFWYLISRDWWLSWIQYTQNTSTTCEYCKSTSSQRSSNVGTVGIGVGGIIDEALVCDESFNSNSLDSMGGDVLPAITTATDNYSLGSASSGISTGRHCGQRPGPIDNTNLVTPNPYKNVRTLTGEGGHLKRDTPLVQNHDFELVPKSLWKALNRWYGDNLPLPRQVIQPPNTNEVELELYPLNLRILLHQTQQHNTGNVNNWGAVSGGYGVMASGGSYAAMSASNMLQPPKRYLAYTAAFSRLATVRQIGDFLCEQLRLRIEDIRLWHIPTGSLDNSAILLEEESMSLKELLIKDNDQFLLEIRNKDLTWPEELGSLTLNQNSTINDRRMTRTSIMSVHAPGATGLHNLGNTCFMNAALQVMFNTQPLAQYFHRNMHLFELNTQNKLGTRGQLATRYAELLKEVWTATTRSVAPLKLRFCVTKHAPQFAGGGQHDSQELLEWFLDALHEDLNRVTEKPYSELKDSNGRPDKIVAAEAWAQHHARNQSIVIDLFYGQLKSKVSCLGCGHESVRFDPFSLLSLPLPVENYVYFEVLVILLDGSVPIKYGLRLNSEAKYIDLKRKLATLCYLNPSFMLICEIWNSQIRQIQPDEEKIRPQSAKELYVYQLPEECGERSRSNSTLGMHIEKGLKDIQRSSALITQDSLNSVQTPKTSFSNIQSFELSHDEQQQQQQHYVMCNGNVNNQLQQNNSNDDDDDEDDTDDQVAAKQSPNLSRSPENTFVNGTQQKRVSSTKLLHNESNTCSSSLTNHSGENSMESSMTDPMPPDPLSSTSMIATQAITTTPASYDLNMAAIEMTTITNVNPTAVTTTPAATPSTATATRATSIDIDDDIENDNSFNQIISQPESSISANQTSHSHSHTTSTSGIFSRVPSQQQYKAGKYLIAVHRKITRHDSYFLSYHKTKPSLFGVPLLIPNCEGGTHKDLYCAVWLQVSRLLSPLPATTEQANHAADCDDSLGYDFPFTLRAVKSDGLTCALCPWSHFCRGCEIPCNNDYILRGTLVPGNATASNSSTPKMANKFSSLPNLETKKPLPPTEYSSSISYTPAPQSSSSSASTATSSAGIAGGNGASGLGFLGGTKYFEDFTIAIDWDPTALHLRYQSTLERLWIEHETIAISRREQIEPVDLNHCLRAFTSEEKLEQWYHCSHCKGKKPATKKLQIWKLPPILIVHLKRFNCVNGKWVKSQKVVHFPFDDFDPTPYLASVPQETILRHRELLELKELEQQHHQQQQEPSSLAEVDEMSIVGETTIATTVKDQFIDNELIEQKLNNATTEGFASKPTRSKESTATTTTTSSSTTKRDKDVPDSTTANPVVGIRPKSNNSAKRQRLISTSLTKTPIVDGEFEDYHHHNLQPDEDKFDPKYKLYAVVSHSGMLNGGHYISYAASSNGTWYCFNDSSCREISNKPNIDPSAAYLLFYERKGLNYEPYLPQIDGRALPNANMNLEVDEADNELKKLCTIS